MTSRKPLTMNSCCSQTHSLGRWREPRGSRPLVSLMPIMFLASGGLMGWWWMVVTAISRCIFQRGTSRGIKPEGLFGQQIHTRMSWSHCLDSMIWYSLSNGPFPLLNCHWICVKVGQFSNLCTSYCEKECGISSLSMVKLSPIEHLP